MRLAKRGKGRKCKKRKLLFPQSLCYCTFSIPPTILSYATKYEKMMEMFGRNGYLCKSVPDVQNALKQAFKTTDAPSIINIIINPSADRKQQDFSWLTESKL